jgi:hypothetical protein
MHCDTPARFESEAAMLAKSISLLLFCASATAAPLPETDQPQLAQLAQPYAQQLRAAGITRVTSPGSHGMVRLETKNGPVYVRYPAGAPDVAFVVDIGPASLQASAATFDKDQDEKALAALVPEALKVTAGNNRLEWARANPWH